MISLRRPVTALAVAALGAGLLTAVAAPASADGTVPPVVRTTAANVRATVLPTAQMDGVGYAQVIIGDTVYVGGEFAKARPAGVPLGGAGEVDRQNLLAYSLSTGKLVNTFHPDVNGKVLALAASPDGTRLYVGGLFTAIDGTPRYRIASFNVGTGRLVPGFKPIPNYVVQAIVATNSTVYFGGKFNNVDGITRSNLAAVRADNGRVLPWAPAADLAVMAMVQSPNRTAMIIAGTFSTLNGVQARGVGSVNTSNGATRPFPTNQIVQAYGGKAAFLTLNTDGKSVYGGAYNFGGSGNFEGAFSANPNTGELNWLEDCHGDTYGVWSNGTSLYTVGHPHACATVGGFPQVSVSAAAKRAMAFTTAVNGTVQQNTDTRYANFAGRPAPSVRQWFPDLRAGTITGSDQAAWAVTGSGAYVVMAGEFPVVNGVAQQGLVRFATAPTSPDTMGPVLQGSQWTPTLTDNGPGKITLTIPGNWDRDDLTLKYTITRDTGTGTPSRTVYRTSVQAVEWNRPTVRFDDSGLTPGTQYRYRVYAADAAGNTVNSVFVTATAPGS